MSERESRRDAVAVARGVSKEFVGGDGTPIHVLERVDLEVAAGESIAIIGQSGSGKSTLLHLLGGLDTPNAGEVRVAGSDLARLAPEPLARLRNEKVGFVFQFHHLLREFTALENVMMPLLVAGEAPRRAEERAAGLLARVGLEHRQLHKPAHLSGGEQQRVAVARALVTHPVLLLADEPSGNLDPPTGERLHDLLFDVSRENAAAMVLVTHNLELAARADRVLRLLGGKLVPAGEEREELPAGSWGD
ncbi:MAG: ABC transporter ATP-binding protein [Gemmatimonadota bacterium]|nr:ABC transporter ATP-binding protein [Gemmatimonadota bacterium]